MVEFRLLLGSLFFYCLGLAGYILFFIFKNIKTIKYRRIAVIIAFILHTTAILARTLIAKRLPLSSQYEFALCFSWGITLCFLIFNYRYKLEIIGVFTLPLTILIIVYSMTKSSEIRPLMPALQSNWLWVHVGTAILSYGAFAVAFGVSILYVARDNIARDAFIGKFIPGASKLDMISYKAVGLGFMLLSIVIITGAIWADRAWGKFWQWDPKEIWALITWLIYAVYLHIRVNSRARGKTAAWYGIIGFLSILFTYIGVSSLFSGYHSY